MASPIEDQMAKLSADQQQVLKSMGVGQSGSPTIKPVTELGGGTPRPAPVDRFPSLEKEVVAGFQVPKFDVTTAPMDLPVTPSLGIELKQDVTPRIADPRKISPEIKLQQVMNFDNPKIVSNFEKAMGVRNAQGEELVFPQSMDYSTRLDVANRMGATVIIDDEGGEFNVPWDNLVYEQTRLPDPDQKLTWNEVTGEVSFEGGKPVPVTELRTVLAKDMTEDDLQNYREASMLTSLNFIDPEVGKPLFADLLNKRLIKAGVESARTRADIINYAVSAPGMGDMEKIASGIGENALKFPIQMGLWGIGELIDAADNLTLNFEDTDQGYFDIRESSRRQAIMDTLWQPLAHKMIATMAQRGTKVSLPVVEEYISTLTGLAPRLVKVAGEIALPSKGAAALTALRSKSEVARFKQFYAEEVAKGSTRSYDEILDSYKQMRSGIDNGAEPSWLQKMKQNSVGSKITKGLQIEDAAMSVGSRAEVVQQTKYLNNLRNRRDAYYSGVKKRGGTPDAADTVKLNAFDADINKAVYDLASIERKSGTPKFMRDIATADKYMVVGAGTAGHFFQQRDETYGVTGDPMMGELVGLGSGLIINLVQGNVPAAFKALQRSAMGQKFGGKKAYLKFLTENITNFSPEMQAGIIERAKYLDEVYDVLVAEGLNPRLLDTGFANLSGLATLKSLEDITRSQLSVKQIRNFNVNDLEANLNLQKQMVAELRGVLQSIEGGIGDTPKGDFFRIVNAAIERGQESIDQLSADISIVDKRGVQYYLDSIDGNSMAFGQQTGPDTIRNFEDSMNRLQRQELISAAENFTFLPRPQFNQIANDTRDKVSDVVAKHADDVRSKLSTQAGAAAVVEGAVGPKGVVAAGQRTTASIPNFDSPGDLMAALLESGHAADKVKAQRLYLALDSASENNLFVDGVGNPVTGNVSVDISDVFDALFAERPDLPVGKLRGADMTAGQSAILDQTFITLSDPFFTALAEGTDKTVKQVVQDIKKTLEDQGKTFNRKQDDQLQVIRYLREAAQQQDSTLDIFEMSFTQLRELDKSLRHVQFAARKSGNAERATIFENIENVVQGKFDKFELVGADGTRTPVDTLGILMKNDVGNDTVMPVGAALQEANRDWSRFKSRWYDTNEKAVVPSWMSWGNRSVVDVSVNNPLGVRYGAQNPREWLNIKAIANMDPNVGGKSLFDSIQRTLGQEIVDPQSGLPMFTFIEGDKMTGAVAATVKTAIADYIVSLKGKVKPDELARQMNNLDQVFVMRGADGQVKSMLDVGSLVDDTIGFSRKSVGDDVYDRTVARVTSDIQTQLDKTLEPAKKAKKQKELAIQILQNYSPTKLSMDQIGDRLVSGGVDQLNLIKRELKDVGGFTDEQVTTILADVYVDSLQNTAFKRTGKNIITDAKGTTIDEQVIDLGVMQNMLGTNDAEKAKVVKELIGEKRYKVWDATSKLMADRAPDFRMREFEITGAPRSFSVESFISRFYAINRGVISARYVGTEAVLQQFRNNKFNMIRSVLSDPELGEMFLEMVRTGKPLTPDRETYFYNALVSSYAKTANEIGKPEPVTMKDKYGRAFTLYPDLTSGIPRTARDALVGPGVKIPVFPEVTKRREDITEGRSFVPVPSIFK
jgi:hypothetical protein